MIQFLWFCHAKSHQVMWHWMAVDCLYLRFLYPQNHGNCVLSYLLDKEIKLWDHPFWFNAVVQPTLLTQLLWNEAAGSDPVPHVCTTSLCILGLARLTLHCPFSPCSNLHSQTSTLPSTLLLVFYLTMLCSGVPTLLGCHNCAKPPLHPPIPESTPLQWWI